MKRYLNWKGETIDELSSTEFENLSSFRKELKRLRNEYALSGMGGAYWSQRPYRGWKS